MKTGKITWWNLFDISGANLHSTINFYVELLHENAVYIQILHKTGYNIIIKGLVLKPEMWCCVGRE